MQKYVVGFMFSYSGQSVLLIKKTKPEQQKGFFNGIGGKVEPNETSLEAMVREFKEETGIITNASSWTLFSTLMDVDNWLVDFYYCFNSALYQFKNLTEEHCLIFDTDNIHNRKILPNLKWLIPLAVDHKTWHKDIRMVSI